MKKNSNIPISCELQELATLFYNKQKTIFIVGGYIRDYLVGKNLEKSDIDICSNCKIEEVVEILEGSKFLIKNINHQFGTLKIISENNKIFEYTTFRKEKYDNKGKHYPINVEFIDDIKKDCLRRDFTCNAIYYDILNNKFIDYFYGIEDIKNKTIKTIRSPEIVFSEDSERILRMIRLAIDLNFNIDDKTYQAAKKCILSLKKISKKRFQNELNKISNIKKLYKQQKLLEDFNIDIM